jgi:uncharacterized membrane protein YsdA (DUF1294 family)
MEKGLLISALIGIMAVMSIIAFILYALDKAKAKRHAWRIPEAMLLGWGFLGGSIGALVAMNTLRHKTKHWYFWVVNIAGLMLHLGLLIAVAVILP